MPGNSGRFSSYFFCMSYGRKRPAKKCFPEKLVAHFLGAVREMRTSGLIPSCFGSSASQPGGRREERVRRWGRTGSSASPVLTLSRSWVSAVR